MTILEAMDTFLEYHQAKGSSEKTHIYYKSNISRFIDFAGDIDIDDITIKLLRDYVKSLQSANKHENNAFMPDDIKKDKLSSISIRTYIRAIRGFLGWLHKEEYINTNFLKMLPLPKAKQKVIEILNDEQIIMINNSFDLKTANGCRNACIFSLMLDSGLRLGEVVKLKVQDIDFNRNIIKILGKGNKERYVPFGYETKKRLYKYFNQRRKVFVDNLFLSEEKPITESAVISMFNRISQSTGIAIHAHLLRHVFATKFLMAGGNVLTLQSILGHTTLEMVKKYCHLSEVYNWEKVRERSVLDRICLRKNGTANKS